MARRASRAFRDGLVRPRALQTIIRFMGRRAVPASRAIDVLIDAAIMGDQAAAEKHRINRRTVYRYRMAMMNDKRQSEEYERVLQEANVRGVEEKLEWALNTAIEHLQYALQQVELDAEGLNAVTRATLALAEIHFGVKLIAGRVGANSSGSPVPSMSRIEQ